MIHFDKCRHGGLARPDGVCILDATHPEVECTTCRKEDCPCGSCRAAHHRNFGHPFTSPLLDAYLTPAKS